MSEMRRAWVLNLDAEHELAARGAYAPTRRMREIVARQRRRLIGLLVAPGDVVLDAAPGAAAHESAPPGSGLPGIAWCPTPRALARLRAAGALVGAAPDVEVLRRVNARGFAATVRAPLAGASFAKHRAGDLDEALRLLARPSPDGWLVRRAFGAAGRGRRRIAAGRPAAAELAWLRAGLRSGELVLEPWVRVTREYTRCGWVTPAGDVRIAAPSFQETSEHGAWLRSAATGRGELPRHDDARLEEAVAVAGAALARAGYFGPFGIDAFRHRVGEGAREVLNPLSEINARFTMDWSLGAPAPEPDARPRRR